MKNYRFLSFFALIFTLCVGCQKDTSLTDSALKEFNVESIEAEEDISFRNNFPGDMMYFYKGASSNYIHRAQSDNCTQWSGNVRLNNSIKCKKGVGAAEFNGDLFVIHKASHNDQVYVAKSSDGINWTDGHIGNNAQTNRAPVAVEFNGKLHTFYKGNNPFPANFSIWTMNTSNGTNWNGNNGVVTPSGQLDPITNTAPGAFAHNGYMYLLIKYDQTGGSSVYDDGEIHIFKTSDGVNWEFEGNAGWRKTKEGVTATVLNGKVYMTFVGYSTNDVFVAEGTFSQNGDINWSSTNTVLSAHTSHRPSIAADLSTDDLVLIYKNDSDNKIHRACSSDFGVTWNGAVQAVGSTSEAPSVIYTN